MNKTKAVDLEHQTLLAILPFIGFWAFVKIKKFGRYMLFMFLLSGIFASVGIIVAAVGGMESGMPIMQTFSAGIVMPFVTYYCRKWSLEWNKKVRKLPIIS